jgi:putative DNA-invertase from lambdoid prophage Rac
MQKPRKPRTYPPASPPSAHPLSTEGGRPRCALYSRASTLDQRPELARDELHDHVRRLGGTITLEIEEHGSGARNDRPGLQRVLLAARRGEIDAVLVHRLDRWGRSVLDTLTNIRALETAGVRFIVTSQGLDIRADGDAVSRLTLHILNATSAFERDLIRERTRLGLLAARKRGVKLGRPKHNVSVERVVALRNDGKSWESVATTLGCTVNVARLRYREGAKATAGQR